jgi:hypothetical protein
MTAFSPEPQTALMVSAGVSFGHAGLHGGLAGRVLPAARCQHLAHDDLPDLGRGHPGALQQGTDDDRPQIGGGRLGQGAPKFADGGAHGTHDDDVLHDGSPSRTC